MDGPARIPEAPPSLDTFLQWAPQPVPVLPVLGAVAAALYLTAVLAARHRGISWPWWRTGLFLTGAALIVALTGSALEGYGYRMFSVFMFQQLTLMMTVPPLLILGAPGTLLLRATATTGWTRPLRRLAIVGLRSRTARMLLHPGFMVPLFLFVFYGLYFSGLATTLLATVAGHQILETVFLAAGVLFTLPLISPDPLPRRQSHLGRLFDMFVEMPLHAFFGVIAMMATVPLVTFFSHAPAGWGIDPIEDQRVAGALAWSYGELPSLIIVLILLFGWASDDTRRAKAADRRKDRDGDPELDAYNAWLARLGRR
ncbi:cytochrome c oxidase assembly protein [Leifsonia sp. NCR5]|uniref:cytochrome c oxidase assembly protein n=1 Tax=Leifsonia sp. NCR5 TaxID=1978342 RepID=UPI000A198E5A|nr:cytochrome c oxidase assembly protein [Leifsonia sp. NCR5]